EAMTDELPQSIDITEFPPATQRVERLFCWVAIQPDGGEGICMIFSGGMPMPVISSKRELLAALRDEVLMQVRYHQPQARIELREFGLTNTLERHAAQRAA